jgi:hypothetical protein
MKDIIDIVKDKLIGGQVIFRDDTIRRLVSRAEEAQSEAARLQASLNECQKEITRLADVIQRGMDAENDRLMEDE